MKDQLSLSEIIQRSELHIRRTAAHLDDDKAFRNYQKTLSKPGVSVALEFVGSFYQYYIDNTNFEDAITYASFMAVEEWNRIFGHCADGEE